MRWVFPDVKPLIWVGAFMTVPSRTGDDAKAG